MLPLAFVSVTLPAAAVTTPVPVILPAAARPPVIEMAPLVVVALAILRASASLTVSNAPLFVTEALSEVTLVLTATEFWASILRTLPTT